MDITAENELLMLPGPVQVAPRVLQAMSKPMINHRGLEFKNLLDFVLEKLQLVFRTRSDLMILSGSGTCAMEAAVGNLGRDKTFAAVENGKFGERLKILGSLYGQSIPIMTDWGKPVDAAGVAAALDNGAEAVTLVHNETSTGMTNNVGEIGRLCKKRDALLIMDGISSIGGMEADIDRWGVDIAFTGSQKCLGLPPGLSIISVSERAWDIIRDAQKRPYYADLVAHKKSADNGQTPYTPTVPLFFALEEALKILEEEGLDSRIRRNSIYANSIRSASLAMGLELFPEIDDLSTYSDTVTAIKVPPSIEFTTLKEEMKCRGIIIAGGQEHLKGRIFRIGNMGSVSRGDILQTVEKLELVLLENGAVDEIGAGTLTADSVLQGV
ncbi:MAG: pyridoxal-phosphate-dependent aminotransferase family protein [Halobacteriota archaeon]